MSARTRRLPCPPPFRARIQGASAVSASVLALLALPAASALAAQPPVGLGTADSYAVLAGAAVTNTGPSTINGDLGVSPGTAISGFPPGTVNGTTHAADAVAAQAQSDLTVAYDDAAGRTPPLAVPSDVGGLTLTPGVYKSGSSLQLTGSLTLDAQGNPNAVFVFQAASSLITASGSHVNLINGAQPCNVVWQVGSSATLGTGSVFTGNVLALTSISLNAGVTVQGRVLARNGAVTLINDTITPAHCATGAGTDGGGTTPIGGGTGGTGGTGTGSPGAPGTGAPGTGAAGTGAQNGAAIFTTTPRAVAVTVGQSGTKKCVPGTFRAQVTGLLIRQVVFSLGTKVIATRRAAPFEATVSSGAGIHVVTARVTFTDGTAPATLRMRFRACTDAQAAVGRPSTTPRKPHTPGGFTG